MTIFPTADLVAGVARAADPEKLRTAASRLGAYRTDATFEHRLVAASPAKVGGAASAQAPLPSASQRAPSLSARAPAEQFEAFLLQSWFEMLLPKEATGFFGSGSAAGVWRTLFAEQVGAQIAHAGGLGLQKSLQTWGQMKG